MPRRPPDWLEDAGVVTREARIVYELFRRGHLKQHPSKVVAKLTQLLRGRPSEDEFHALLAWLGTAKLIHVLDQQQLPPSSKEKYQVPDFLAVFDYGGRDTPALIEVKRSRGLRFSERYYARLSAYAQSVGLPLLVAWKIGTFWTLVPLTAFQRIKTAWRCSLEQAMLHNVMSVLAGDFAVTFVEGASCRMLARREEIISSRAVSKTKRSELWRMRIEEFSVTGRNGEEIRRLPNLLFWILITLGEWEEKVKTTADAQEIVGRYQGGMGFIQQCLPLALDAENSRLPPARLWKARLDAWTPRFTAASAREVLVRGLHLGLVHIVADIQPKELPPYLPKLPPDPSRYFVVP